MFIGSPDPFAVVTVDGEQTQTTEVAKKTLNPEWNQTVGAWPLIKAKNFYFLLVPSITFSAVHSVGSIWLREIARSSTDSPRHDCLPTART